MGFDWILKIFFAAELSSSQKKLLQILFTAFYCLKFRRPQCEIKVHSLYFFGPYKISEKCVFLQQIHEVWKLTHMFNRIFLNSFQWEETRGSIFWLHIKKFTKKGKRSYPCMLNLLNQSQAKKVPHELWFCDCPYKSTLKWTSHLSAWNN